MIDQAVVLAAGRGERLGTVTRHRPKAMLPILGKPIIARVMDRMREAGTRRFVVVVGEQESTISAYLAKYWYPACEVRFVVQPMPLGTADALRQAVPHIDGPFLLSSCDNLVPPDHISALVEHFDAFGGDLVLTLIHSTPEDIARSACVEVKGDRVIRCVEKPPVEEIVSDLASIMIYACDLGVLEGIDHVPCSDRGEKEFVHVIAKLIESGGRVGHLLARWRLHLTNEHDLLRINRRFLEEGRDAHILSELPGAVAIRPPVRIDPQVSVRQRAVIGPNVYLESGCTVGQGAVITDSVVLSGGGVPAGEEVHGQVVASRERLCCV